MTEDLQRSGEQIDNSPGTVKAIMEVTRSVIKDMPAGHRAVVYTVGMIAGLGVAAEASLLAAGRAEFAFWFAVAALFAIVVVVVVVIIAVGRAAVGPVSAEVDEQAAVPPQLLPKTVTVRVEDPVRGKQSLQVYRLQRPEKGRLALEWPTVCFGIERLWDQIEAEQSLNFDLVVGVNAAGAMVAAYLDGRHKRDGFPVITVKTSSKLPDGERPRRWVIGDDDMLGRLLDKSAKPGILVVDSELKSGGSYRLIERDLEERFGNPSIHYAVLGVYTDKALQPTAAYDIEDLVLSGAPTPHFVAFVAEGYGFEPPGHIR